MSGHINILMTWRVWMKIRKKYQIISKYKMQHVQLLCVYELFKANMWMLFSCGILFWMDTLH